MMKTNINPMRLLCLVLTLSLWHMNAKSDSIVETLPGFPGALPFKLRTGYVGVGESEEVQLFYYFIESQRSPKDDPLILWLTGGPGCSSLFAIVYENGPFSFDYANLVDGKPTLKSNPYAWTEMASIIFLDSPVGTGFSYATTPGAYAISDTEAGAQAASFLRKWLMDYHPEYLNNPLYIGGDSYSGMVVPVVVQDIYDGNDAGDGPPLNIQGYILGNALTDRINDVNVRLRYAHRLALISDSLYKSAKKNCNGKYVNVDPNNTVCISDLQTVSECVDDINPQQILEPNCDSLSPRPNLLRWDPNIIQEDPNHLLIRSVPEPWCRSYNYLYSFMWANDRTVREALHIRKGTKDKWVRCNTTISAITFDYNLESVLSYHRNFTKKRCRALVYSGDHDTVVPYLATLDWINKLNLSVTGGWRPWFVGGQVAGYTEQYTENLYKLTFATVLGAGHGAPEYKPKECFGMVSRWLAHFPV